MAKNTREDREQDLSRSVVAERTTGEVVDRLAGLLPAEELEEALRGLEPEQITGPGGFRQL